MAEITYSAGTNGFTVAPFDLLTTELNSLATGNTAISSVGGSSGVFSQTQTLGYIWGVLCFVSGGSFTPTGGGIDVWFLGKDDDANHQKYTANADQARAPDAYINFLATAHASGDVVGARGLTRLPAHPFKVLARPTPGVSLPSSGNKIKLGCIAVGG